VMTFRIRILLDFIAAGLIIACLAYWWLDNLSHELLGTALFGLVIAHNVFNRRWHGAVAKGRYGATRIINLVTIIALALAMLVLLVTSLLISRDLFSFTALDGGFAVREIHMFTAYWVVLILAIHLGTRWTMVMQVCRTTFGINSPSRLRTVVIRCIAAAIALWGVTSMSEMAFGSKLMLTYSLDMWDFQESTVGFFVNYACIVGLVASLTHYALGIIRHVGQTASATQAGRLEP